MRLNFESLETEVLSYLSSLSLDENKLLLLREELAEIARLERKYRCNDSGLIELLKTSKARLSTLADLNDGKELGKKLQTCREELQAIAHELSKRREISGNTLVKAVEKDLTSLSMPEAKIKVEIEEADFSESGCDLLEFLISTNKGEMFKPLRQIASGGELSRIMLVLKKNLKDRSGVNVLVFDEVDTGISGSVARAVGEKLKNLSAHSQVICITHLAQIASLADIHILVNKEVNDRTISLVKVLQGEEKVDEIARMLAGYEITDATRESAKELLSS